MPPPLSLPRLLVAPRRSLRSHSSRLAFSVSRPRLRLRAGSRAVRSVARCMRAVAPFLLLCVNAQHFLSLLAAALACLPRRFPRLPRLLRLITRKGVRSLPRYRGRSLLVRYAHPCVFLVVALVRLPHVALSPPLGGFAGSGALCPSGGSRSLRSLGRVRSTPPSESLRKSVNKLFLSFSAVSTCKLISKRIYHCHSFIAVI